MLTGCGFWQQRDKSFTVQTHRIVEGGILQVGHTVQGDRPGVRHRGSHPRQVDPRTEIQAGTSEAVLEGLHTETEVHLQ